MAPKLANLADHRAGGRSGRHGRGLARSVACSPDGRLVATSHVESGLRNADTVVPGDDERGCRGVSHGVRHALPNHVLPVAVVTIWAPPFPIRYRKAHGECDDGRPTTSPLPRGRRPRRAHIPAPGRGTTRACADRHRRRRRAERAYSQSEPRIGPRPGPGGPGPPAGGLGAHPRSPDTAGPRWQASRTRPARARLRAHSKPTNPVRLSVTRVPETSRPRPSSVIRTGPIARERRPCPHGIRVRTPSSWTPALNVGCGRR